MARTRQFDGKQPKGSERRKIVEGKFQTLHVQVKNSTMRWLCKVAQGGGIGLALDNLAAEQKAMGGK